MREPLVVPIRTVCVSVPGVPIIFIVTAQQSTLLQKRQRRIMRPRESDKPDYMISPWKRYETEMRAEGIQEILKIGMAFRRKEIAVKTKRDKGDASIHRNSLSEPIELSNLPYLKGE